MIITRNLRNQHGCETIHKKERYWQQQADFASLLSIKRIKSVAFNNELYEFDGLQAGAFIGPEIDTSDVFKYTPCIG